MTVDRNIVIKFHKQGESNSSIAKRLKMNRTTVWKIVKKFNETGTTLDKPGRGRKRTVRTPKLVKNTREKLRRNPHRSHRKLAAEANVSNSTMYRVMKDDLGKKPYKMLHRHELTEHHKRMRMERSRQILDEIDQGTLPNLVFTDEKKFDIQQVVNQQNDRVWGSSTSVEGRIVTRRQNPQSVMIWAAVTPSGRSPLVFVPSGVKLNSERYVSDILESHLLPWADKHFQGLPWSLQQDSAPSHGSKMTQTWIQRKIPSFISKELWPARSPDLNPLDFSIWSILKAKVSACPHSSLDALKAKLKKEWDAIPQEQIRAACDAFVGRLKAVVRNKGGYIE